MNEVDRRRTAIGAIWISDIHLGTRGCKAELLLDFLQPHRIRESLSGRRHRRRLAAAARAGTGAQSHNDVVQKILRKARKGTRVDLRARAITTSRCATTPDMQFGGITCVGEAIHETADGRRLLVLHGDDFDGVVQLRPLARLPRRPRLQR